MFYILLLSFHLVLPEIKLFLNRSYFESSEIVIGVRHSYRGANLNYFYSINIKIFMCDIYENENIIKINMFIKISLVFIHYIDVCY